MSEAHHEKQFESYVVDQLVGQGWLLGNTTGYDKNYALYPEDLVAWLKATQLHFFRYQSPRPLHLIDAELKQVESEIAAMLNEVAR